MGRVSGDSGDYSVKKKNYHALVFVFFSEFTLSTKKMSQFPPSQNQL